MKWEVETLIDFDIECGIILGESPTKSNILISATGIERFAKIQIQVTHQ